ncbi:unnamed protein product, partial [Prorocentrum cordatum]
FSWPERAGDALAARSDSHQLPPPSSRPLGGAYTPGPGLPEAMGPTPALGKGLCRDPVAGAAGPAPGLAGEGCGRLGREGARASGAAAAPPEGFAVDVLKRPGDVLGAALGNSEEGAVVVAIEERGLLGEWNRAHPERALRPGCLVTRVNGATGYWSILEEIQRPGALVMRVSTNLPKMLAPTGFAISTSWGRGS